MSIDGLHPKKDICALITDRITEFTGIPRENVMIAFTHSHTALPFRFEGIAFENDEVCAKNTEGYPELLAKLVADCVTLASLRLRPATPEVFSVPVQCIGIGEFTIYGFNSEIFTKFGKIVKRGDGTGKALVATLCNDAFGYVPTRDMFYDTIYESRPGSKKQASSSP